MKHVDFYTLPIGTFFIRNEKVYQKIKKERALDIKLNKEWQLDIASGCVIDNFTFSKISPVPKQWPIENEEKMKLLDMAEEIIVSNNASKEFVTTKEPLPVATLHAPETKTVFGDIAERYAKSGGVPIKKRYSDEVKERESQ